MTMKTGELLIVFIIEYYCHQSFYNVNIKMQLVFFLVRWNPSKDDSNMHGISNSTGIYVTGEISCKAFVSF